jgi:hypothetical protein
MKREVPPPQGETLPSSRALVRIEEARTARDLYQIVSRKPDNRMSDDAWIKLHNVGEMAVDKLKAMIEDAGFEKRPLGERLKIIDMALNRAYGNPEMGPRRNMMGGGGKYKAPVESQATGNTLTRLARTARYPELRKSDGDSAD